MSEIEDPYARMQRIYTVVEDGGQLPVDDQHFLWQRFQNAEQMLLAQQSAVDDAARRWRQIGYDDGYQAGYAKAAEDCPVCREQVDG